MPRSLKKGPFVDEHLLRNGEGFETHHHAGVTIVTWPLSGEVTHTDSTGAKYAIYEGAVKITGTFAGEGEVEVRVRLTACKEGKCLLPSLLKVK